MQNLLEHPVLNDMLKEDSVSAAVPGVKAAKDVLDAVKGDEGELQPAVVGGALLASAGMMAYGAYDLATDIGMARHRLADMLMHDKYLPETFRDGQFADLIRSQKEDYIHLRHRPSPGFVSAAGEAVDALKMRNHLAKELKEGGVSLSDAVKEYRVMGKAGMLRSAGMVAAGAVGWRYAMKHKEALENELDDSPGRG